jgi:hypothetical protein
MSTSVLQALAAESTHNALPMPPYAYGLMAMTFFLVLLGVLWSFRNTNNKYAPPSQSHGTHGQVGHGSHAALEDAPATKHHGH